jgi:putative lipoic acid-binding regulatory protein
MFRTIHGKPDIKYPCLWEYKIFGKDQDRMHQAVEGILAGGYELTLSRSSSRKKYHCMNLVIEVLNDQDRQEIYRALNTHEDILLVL